MYYLVYKITNKINGKFYIGVHRTVNKDDGYMGSGKIIIRAIDKHGEENFTKEILHECSSVEEMFQKEKELVVVDREISYNIVEGGKEQGFDGSEHHRAFSSRGGIKHRVRCKFDEEYYFRVANNMIKVSSEYRERTGKYQFEGKHHTDESKKKIGKANSIYQKGKGNSQFGTMWIKNVQTNESKRIKKTDQIPDGWIKGRKINTRKHI